MKKLMPCLIVRKTYFHFGKKWIGISIIHNYNKILESNCFLAHPVFQQIGAQAAICEGVQ